MDFYQLAQELNQYCTQLQNQIAEHAFPLETKGISVITEALENTSFLKAACDSLKNDFEYRQCTQSAFSFSNELLGLKNSINRYNDTQSTYTLYMITSDINYVKLYLTNMLN